MQNDNHAHPAFIMTRDPRPGDRETRMHPAPGKWIIRSDHAEQEETE